MCHSVHKDTGDVLSRSVEKYLQVKLKQGDLPWSLDQRGVPTITSQGPWGSKYFFVVTTRGFSIDGPWEIITCNWAQSNPCNWIRGLTQWIKPINLLICWSAFNNDLREMCGGLQSGQNIFLVSAYFQATTDRPNAGVYEAVWTSWIRSWSVPE